MSKSININIFSFVLAFCGLTYEFIFAQSLSVLLGNSVVQYALTIGVFMAGLGLGSYRTEQGPRRNEESWLFSIQLLLSIGVPFIFVGLWLSAIHLNYLVTMPLSYTAVFAIGYFTGVELPLLMRMAGERQMQALAMDYMGMLVACVAFPYFFLPQWGIFKTLAFVALLNSVIAALLFRARAEIWRWALIPTSVILIVFFFSEEGLRTWLSQQFINAAL